MNLEHLNSLKPKQCLNVVSADNSVLKVLDNRPDARGNPQAIQTLKIPVPGPKAGAKPRGMLVLGTD